MHALQDQFTLTPLSADRGLSAAIGVPNPDPRGLIWKTPVGAHNGHDNDSLRALEHRSTLKAPLTILPGSLGGVLADLAVAGNSVYVATIDLVECLRLAGGRAGGLGYEGCPNYHSAPPRSPTTSSSQRSTTVS